MPGHFVLRGGRVSVPDQSIAESAAFEKYVDPVKFVHNIFFDIDGTAEIWCELELGNDHPEEAIKIKEVEIGFNNIGRDDSRMPKPEMATTSHNVSDDDEVPLLLESEQGPRSGEQWHEMYDELELLDDDNEYFVETDKESSELDKIFDYRIGSAETLQHVYATPVAFEVDRITEGENEFVLTGFRKLNCWRRDDSGSPPRILPKPELESTFSDPSRFEQTAPTGSGPAGAGGTRDENRPERVDTISIWLYWEEPDLCVPKDDISYHFRYAVDCGVDGKQFTHVYPHYILPEDSVLMGRALLMESLSEQRVEEFHPPKPRWMFREWEQRYGVRNMSSARMTRSKEKRTDHMFNSGRIGFPSLRARLTGLQFVLVILGGWAVQATASSLTVETLLDGSFPLKDILPLTILPVSLYLLVKSHGPPPYFPSRLHRFVAPSERWLFGPAGRSLSWLLSAPFDLLR